jgi:hypothetical protein
MSPRYRIVAEIDYPIFAGNLARARILFVRRRSWWDLYQTRSCLVSEIVHEEARRDPSKLRAGAGPYG